MIMSSVETSSAAAEVPLGAVITKVNETICVGKVKDQVLEAIKDAKTAGVVVMTFETPGGGGAVEAK